MSVQYYNDDTIVMLSSDNMKHIHAAPSFVRGRKGQTSLVDSLVRALWVQDGKWPKRTFRELQGAVSKTQRYEVSASTIRSAVYGYPDLFVKCEPSTSGRSVRWRLSEKAMRAED